MQVVIRDYSTKGSTELFDVLEKHKAELEPIMGSVQGLVSYTLARGGTGGFSVTICQDQAGIDESIGRAKDFIAKNAAHVAVEAPKVAVGKVLLHLK
jgi:hypothetical protein